MIKRILLTALLIAAAVTFTGCGGGGDSSLSTPDGVNPGIASRVELMATAYVNQSNGYCYLKTKVLDGNGAPIQNRQVVYTNLSTTGVLDRTTAMTDHNGIATVTLYSTTWGFATVQAEVNADNTGTEKIRDKKTVFFTPFDMVWPVPSGGLVDLASLTLEVDSDNDGVYDEPSDFILFDPVGKSDAIIRATVTDSDGFPLLNSEVTFGADSPEVTFPLGSDPAAPVVHTNADGQASILARVSPTILRSSESTVNITASADNNTFNVLTLFLKPVTVNTVTLAADPAVVASAGTSTISATVTTTAGNLVPDGTVVNFTTTLGSITPFSATTDGVAEADFTAPTVTAATSATITGSVGGKTGTRIVNITAPVVVPATLTIVPANATICEQNASCTAGITSRPFIIRNVASVSCAVTSANTALIANPSPPAISGSGPDRVFTASSTLTNSIPAGPTSVAVDLLVSCTGFNTTIVTVTVTNQ